MKKDTSRTGAKKRKKTYVKAIICLLCIIVFCSVLFIFYNAHKSGTVDKSEFSQIAKEYGYTYVDYTEDYKADETFKSVQQAHYENTCWIELYEIINDAQAKQLEKEFFNGLKTEIRNTEDATCDSSSGQNFSTKTLQTDSAYIYVSRVNNSVLCVSIFDLTQLDRAKSIIRELNY